MNIETIYSIYLKHPSVQTDTRKLKKGDIFFALKGDNFNGNLFVQKAFELGASYCVVDEENAVINKNCILVNDVLNTLQSLAKKHRSHFNIPFIAITGSNGKTTTKELIYAVLSTQYKTYTTEGNLNNHIGIPLTILKIKPDAEMAVIEMGANHQKEIEGYCEYAMPNFGLITNCGKAHLEGFGGEEGVRKGKGELYQYLKKQAGHVFLFDDYNYLHEMLGNYSSLISYGTLMSNANIVGDIKSQTEFLEVEIIKGASIPSIKTQLVGGYNLPNILAAVCIGKYFEISDLNIKDALEAYTPSNSRSQLMKSGTNTIILDAYNANPSSMELAIENFAAMPGEKKILLLGAMAEMGTESEHEHKQIVALINNFKWQQVVLVGEGFKNSSQNYLYFQNSEEAKNWFHSITISDALILVKGSRSIQMEKILE
jgi:UDP-N-acetylmuramoyl-tripeptide--D-alanyl-D-alanine ligase